QRRGVQREFAERYPAGSGVRRACQRSMDRITHGGGEVCGHTQPAEIAAQRVQADTAVPGQRRLEAERTTPEGTFLVLQCKVHADLPAGYHDVAAEHEVLPAGRAQMLNDEVRNLPLSGRHLERAARLLRINPAPGGDECLPGCREVIHGGWLVG